MISSNRSAVILSAFLCLSLSFALAQSAQSQTPAQPTVLLNGQNAAQTATPGGAPPPPKVGLFGPAAGQNGASKPGVQVVPAPVVPRPMMGLQRTPPNAELADKDLNKKVDDLIKQLTIEEKVGQLAQYSAGQPTGPGTGVENYEMLIAQGRMGAMLNVSGAKDINHYQHIAMEQSPHKIPLLFGLDVIHGYKTEFPVPLGMASSFDPDAVEQAARTAAEEASAEGVRWTFSPMVDIARDARWGRIVESAGEDPYLGSAMARAYVHGYQGKSLGGPTSLAACIKHFAGYGAAEAGREYNTTDMSDYTLREVYLPPYKAGVDAGAASVMSAFNSLNGVPASANPYTLTRILRREWGFQGLVVSDWNAVKELEAHGIALDDSTAAYKAFAGGVDMDMQSNLYNKELAQLVKDEKIPPNALDEAVRRVLRVKFALGLFEHPFADENAPPVTVTAQKREQERKMAMESIVLLKNQNNALPLRNDLKTIALIGPLADSPVDMLGSWIGKGNPADAVTLRAALTEHLQGKPKLLYALGCDVIGDSQAGFKDAVKAAKAADVVLLALGERADAETGEAASLAHLDNPGSDTQQKLLEAVAATGKPVVLVLFNGHPLALTKSEPLAAAIVEAWYPGTEAGNAVYHLLFGDANFSAKLPVSMPRATGQEPLYYAQLPTGRPALNVDLTHPPTEGTSKYVSRYVDEQNSALYPFGYGLSYTTFSYSQPTISSPSLTVSKIMTPRGQPTDEKLTIGVDVKNTGSVAGTDVAQLYLRVMGGSTEQPVRALKGFQRVMLAPGESKHVEFKVGFDEMSYITLRGAMAVEPANDTFFVGDSSLATNQVEFKIEADPRPARTEGGPPKPPATTPAAGQPSQPAQPVPLAPLNTKPETAQPAK